MTSQSVQTRCCLDNKQIIYQTELHVKNYMLTLMTYHPYFNKILIHP